ncbi:hypothetical protein FBALC1_15097 [Flavobacteriales bacterium ALC-1]|nr:hypothetical protein FBALC1_15097 [Flavobacteriales bacterium ALC-1]
MISKGGFFKPPFLFLHYETSITRNLVFLGNIYKDVPCDH